MGALSLKQVGNADSESERAFMYKGEGEILFSFLVKSVFFCAYLCFLRHISLGNAAYLTHFSDSHRNLFKLTVG